MKKVACPKCGTYLTFNENSYPVDRILVFICPSCQKQFKVRLASPNKEEEPTYGNITVLENTFHERQDIPLHMGDNVFGRYVKGTSANAAITTSDPSIDTTHCIITVKKDKKGNLRHILRDAPSLTGTFYQGNILKDTDKIYIENGAIINIGGTTMIVNLE